MEDDYDMEDVYSSMSSVSHAHSLVQLQHEILSLLLKHSEWLSARRWEHFYLLPLLETKDQVGCTCTSPPHPVIVFILLYKQPLFLPKYLQSKQVWQLEASSQNIHALQRTVSENDLGSGAKITTVLYNPSTNAWLWAGCHPISNFKFTPSKSQVFMTPSPSDTSHQPPPFAKLASRKRVWVDEVEEGEQSPPPASPLPPPPPPQRAALFTRTRLYGYVQARLVLYQLYWRHGKDVWGNIRDAQGTDKVACLNNPVVNDLAEFLCLDEDVELDEDRCSFQWIREWMFYGKHPWREGQDRRRSAWEDAEWSLVMWRWVHCERFRLFLFPDNDLSLSTSKAFMSTRDVFRVGRTSPHLQDALQHAWTGQHACVFVHQGRWTIPHPLGMQFALAAYAQTLFDPPPVGRDSTREDPITDAWRAVLLESFEPVLQKLEYTYSHSLIGSWRLVDSPTAPLVDSFLDAPLCTYSFSPLNDVASASASSSNHDNNDEGRASSVSVSKVGRGKTEGKFAEVKIWPKRPPIRSNEFKRMLAPCMQKLQRMYLTADDAGNKQTHLVDGGRWRFLHQYKIMGYSWKDAQQSLSPSVNWTGRHTTKCKATYQQTQVFPISCRSLFNRSKVDPGTMSMCPFFRPPEGKEREDDEAWKQNGMAAVQQCRQQTYAQFPVRGVFKPESIGSMIHHVSEYRYKSILQNAAMGTKGMDKNGGSLSQRIQEEKEQQEAMVEDDDDEGVGEEEEEQRNLGRKQQ